MSAQTTLDEIWIKDESSDKDFYGGLIQIAVAMYHLTNDNARGSTKIYSRARDMVIKYGEEHLNVSLKALIASLDGLFARENLSEMATHELTALIPKIETLDSE